MRHSCFSWNKTESIYPWLTVEDKDELAWLEPAFRQTQNKVALYVEVEYNVPPELSLTAKEYRENIYDVFTWDSNLSSFKIIPDNFEMKMKDRIQEVKLLTK